MKNRFFIALFAMFLAYSAPVIALPTAKLTLKVVDGEGAAVEAVDVGMGFESRGRVNSRSTGRTGSDGTFVASGSTSGYVGFSLRKQGYYTSYGHFRDFSGVNGVYGLRRWQPWNPTVSVLLRKVRNPIPLYVKTVEELVVPELNRPLGYDIEVGDWAAPFGQGVSADFVFYVENEFKGRQDFFHQVSLGFSNDQDGIIIERASRGEGSGLLLPHRAPIGGYESKYSFGLKAAPDRAYQYIGESQTDDLNFFFRVRSVLDNQGNRISALYGKIHGKIEISSISQKKPTLWFTYFLNPSPNNTNLEWDQKTNLFDGRPNN